MLKNVTNKKDSIPDIFAKLGDKSQIIIETKQSSQVTQFEILQRLEALEQSNDMTRHNMGLIKEILEAMNDIPLFRLILKRAINRQTLTSIQFGILPRRKRYLKTIQRMKGVPPAIRQTFIDRQKELIKQAINIIRHRRNFDQRIRNQIARFLYFSHTSNRSYHARTQ